jgi:hypothetical protein
MAKTITRIFNHDKSNKGTLSTANSQGGSCPNLNTEFALTGKFTVEDGWTDSHGDVQNKDRQYAYFEGKRNGKEVPAGISAGVFLRRPFGGFTEEEEKRLTDFHRGLLDCISAEDFFDLCEDKGVFNGKSLVVKDIVRHTETPYGKDKEYPVRYAIFDIK